MKPKERGGWWSPQRFQHVANNLALQDFSSSWNLGYYFVWILVGSLTKRAATFTKSVDVRDSKLSDRFLGSWTTFLVPSSHRVTKLRSTNADFLIGSFLDRKQLRKLMHEDMMLVATNGSTVGGLPQKHQQLVRTSSISIKSKVIFRTKRDIACIVIHERTYNYKHRYGQCVI